MFARFTTSSTEITPAGLGRLLRAGPVGALLLVVVGWGALTYGRPLVETIDPFSLGGGRLLPELGAAWDLSAASDCRSDACTLETASPAPAPPLDVPARWLPDPVDRLSWPARPAYPQSFMADDLHAWIAEARPDSPGSTSGGWVLRNGSNEGGLHYANIDVRNGGYVSRLVFPEESRVAPLTAESHGADRPRRQILHAQRSEVLRRWRAEGNGRGPDGRIDHYLMPPEKLMPSDPLLVSISPEWIEFQPMTMPLRVQLPPEMVDRVRTGDPATLRFEAPIRFSPPFDVSGKVTGMRGGVALVETDEPTDRWLRTYFATAIGRAPATDRLTLRVSESLGGRAGAGVRVPASAVVRRAGDAGEIVWVIAAGLAAPVNVRAGKAEDGFVTVNEIISPLSGAIHPTDWRAMTPQQRALLHRFQSRLPAEGNRLLDARAQVVVRPDAALRAGTSARSR